MAERDDEDLDRAAILARRRRYIAQALAELERPARVGPKAKLMAVAVSGLATACPRPCLSDAGGPIDPIDETETGETDTETADTGTDETGTTT
jgi:hypothetical protein